MGRVVIGGGGVVGLASGLALARRGADVMLVDADVARRAASWGNAGHIAIEQVEPLASRAAIRSAPRRLFSRGGGAGAPCVAMACLGAVCGANAAGIPPRSL